MKNLISGIWNSPASTAASAIVSGLAAVIANDVDLPKWVMITAATLSAVLAAFAGKEQLSK